MPVVTPLKIGSNGVPARFGDTDSVAMPMDIEPAVNQTSQGHTTNSKNAGATITIMDCVYLDSGGTWQQTSASALGTANGELAISLESKTVGQAMKVALPGSIVRNDAWAWATIGATLYLSTTSGAITDTAPTNARIIGYVLTDDCIMFAPAPSVLQGDILGPTSSVDSEVTLFSGTSGKVVKRATGSGVAIVTSGVLSTKTNPTGAFVGDTDTQTITNKRVNPREETTASSATPTPNIANGDIYTITALAANATFGSPTGTPLQGQRLLIRVKDNGTARTLAWNAIYRAIGIILPTTTTISKTLYVGCVYNSTDTKWDVIAVAEEA